MSALDELVAVSRRIGADSSLVLHGGGNTSVKTTELDVHGEPVEVLWVKGSGWDLATIEPAGFAPLRLDAVRRLADLDELSDAEMVNQLRCSLLDASAPTPSVEAILHAILPGRFVLHSHADAILALTNTPTGEERIRELYVERTVVIPYVMPGFDLARETTKLVAGRDCAAVVLMNHGVFTWDETADVALDQMYEMIAAANEASGYFRTAVHRPTPAVEPVALAEIRRDVSDAAGEPMIVTRHVDQDILAFLHHDLARVSQQGPATPDHVIRTKRLPLVGRDVEAYAAAYRSEFERLGNDDLQMLDPAPRVVLDPEFAMLTCGRTAADADIAADVYRHTIDVIMRAEAHGGYRALPAEDIFAVEYWELEQAKLKRAGELPPLAGQVALVTGSASGIGRACVEALEAAGGATIGLDLADGVDVTKPEAVEEAISAGVARYGGIDIAVVSAGVFGTAAPIAELDMDNWRSTMAVNADAVASLFSAVHPFLCLAPRRGRVVVVGSKNVAAPGSGAAAYSASKAAVTQLARVAALEWASDGITVNVVHPDAVFDTGLWSDDLIAERAAHYGMTPDEYRTRNLLGAEVCSTDVAAAVLALVDGTFPRTTGAQIPIDGGNERVV